MSLAVELAQGVYRIPTTPMDLINTFVLVDDDGQVTLVDAGVRGATGRILAGLAEIGVAPGEVTRIVVTHAHFDHVGGLRSLAEKTGGEVSAHSGDAEEIRTGRGTATDPSSWFGRLVSREPGSPATPVHRELVDGETLPIGGGLRVVHTPGHTPGHVSLLHLPSRVLITGDAIWNMNSRRTWPVIAFCTDGALTKRSAHRLAELDYTTAAFTHGPEIRGSGREAVRSFLSRPRGFRMLR